MAIVASGVASTTLPAGAAFPGTNGVIACATNRTGNFEIFTFLPNGPEGNPTNITFNPAVDGRPRYRSDGTKIAFESSRLSSSDIYIADANGTNVQRVTFTGDASGPAWHPDGSQLLYQRSSSTNLPGLSFEVYKVNIDGTGSVPLASSPFEDSLAFWSPDGTTIAFSSRRVDSAADVHLMDSFGNNVVDITNRPGVEDSWPNWSPDGTQIVFHSRRDDAGGEEIYRMNADGSNVVRLTNQVGPFDIFPFWSPDGTRIGWNSSGFGAANFGEIFHMSAVDGSDVRRVTSNVATDQRCDWQPLCTIYGSGNITGTEGDDIICGSEGVDRIAGLGGNDIMYGFGGDDQFSGGAGNDRMFGGLGNDLLVGGPGTDFSSAGPGDDRISADAGERIDVGAGSDLCSIGGAAAACPPRLS
jgi:Tol biopolymer transport system component